MKRNFRLEYFLPNIADTRKYQYLINATLTPPIMHSGDSIDRCSIKNGDIGLTDDECIDLFVNREYKQSGSKEFLQWILKQRGIFNLDTDNAWNNEVLNKLATFLVDNPTSLPYFLDRQCISIVGALLGDDYFYSEVHSVISCSPKGAFSHVREDRDGYAENFQWAKHKLSLLLAVIDKLIDLGINVDEYTFRNLDACKTFGDIQTAGSWMEPLEAHIPENGYRRRDGHFITRKELQELLNFDSFSGFLDTFMKFAEYGHLYAYCSDEMMDPSKIVPLLRMRSAETSIKKKSIIDPYENVCPKESRIDIKTCCRMFKGKLQAMRIDTEYNVLTRKLRELRTSIEDAQNVSSYNWEALNSKFRDVYDEIRKLPTSMQTGLIKNLEGLAKSGKIELDVQESNSLEERVGRLEGIVADNSSRIKSVEKSIDSIEKSLTSIYQFIDKGTPIPDEVLNFLTKRDVVKIMKYPSSNKSASLRKSLIVGALLLGSLPLLTSSSVLPNPVLPEAILAENHAGKPGENLEGTSGMDSEKDSGKGHSSDDEMKLFSKVVGQRKWYLSIYDQEPAGMITRDGIITKYYALESGVCVMKIDTEKELKEFIKEQGENVRNFTWKAAVCALNEEVLQEFIESGNPVPSDYTTYFVDYEPSLNFDFNHQEPGI